MATTSDTVRSDLLEACQTAWYNGSTSSTPELNPDGSFEDIMCVTSAGNVSYQNAQCQDGYNGLLCTNCDNGWGNSRTFHCNQCMSSVPTNTFLIFLGHLASFCYVAWLVRGSLASAAQVGRAEADHFEQFSDMMKVRLSTDCCPVITTLCVDMGKATLSLHVTFFFLVWLSKQGPECLLMRQRMCGVMILTGCY